MAPIRVLDHNVPGLKRKLRIRLDAKVANALIGGNGGSFMLEVGMFKLSILTRLV